MNAGKEIIYLALLMGILMQGCKKEEYIEERDYPRLDLNDKIIQDAKGISFEAYIIARAGEIDDKGFVWDEGTGANLANGALISLGPGYENGKFTATIDYGIEKGLTYEVRAYLISGGRTIYSKRGSFVSGIDGTN